MIKIGECSDSDRDRIGQKAVILNDLLKLGLPIPPGIVIPAQELHTWDESLLAADLLSAAKEISKGAHSQTQAASTFSVRSSSPLSMPGVLATILGVGVSPRQLKGSAYDKQLLRMLRRACSRLALANSNFGHVVTNDAVKELMQEPDTQIRLAIRAVVDSWYRGPARDFRRQSYLPDRYELSVIIQKMVVGNVDDQSGSGVVSTRNPTDGQRSLTGQFAFRSEGHKIVSGVINELSNPLPALERRIPKAWNFLQRAATLVEMAIGSAAEIEFTIESGCLWILQARAANLSRRAELTVIRQMHREGLIPADERCRRRWVASRQRREDVSAPSNLPKLAEGLSASPGIGVGRMAVLGDANLGNDAQITAVDRLDPFDHANDFFKAEGFVSRLGGTSSHAATLARKLGRPYVSGCANMRIQPGTGVWFGSQLIANGEIITVDGNSGAVYLGAATAGRQKFRRAATSGAQSPHRAWWHICPDNQSSAYQAALADLDLRLSQSANLTEKSRLTIALGIFPSAMRIQQIPIAASNEALLRELMLDGVANGWWVGAKCASASVTRLGNGRWQAGIRSNDEVEAFLSQPDFLGPGGSGGYPSWLMDSSLSEIIVIYDPPGKGASEYSQVEFVFTVGLHEGTGSVEIEILDRTWKLRELERAEAPDLISLAGEPDPQARDQFRRFATRRTATSRTRDDIGDGIDGHRSSTRRSDALVQAIGEAVFFRWWRPPVSLPALMAALQARFDVEFLEFQGRLGAKDESDYMLLFDVKGVEEARFALGN